MANWKMGVFVEDWETAVETNNAGNRPAIRQNAGVRFDLGKKQGNQPHHCKKASPRTADLNLIFALN
jgi:hypothetical protein